MAVVVKQLTDFLQSLDSERGQTKFTWLIGSGMSVSSGIPLAKGISWRIITFGYLRDVVKTRPWAPEQEQKQKITYENDLDDFLEWYERTEKNELEFSAWLRESILTIVANGLSASLAKSSVLFLPTPPKGSTRKVRKPSPNLLAKIQGIYTKYSISANALAWLQTKTPFANITPDSPDCYQLLFEHLFQGVKSRQVFLTSIVNRARGVNLAHLALAGILRDHEEQGHTVFTTNFDDLLLRALMSINYTARIFGDLKMSELPSFDPEYPQIVHLHGRHVGYRLLNTPGEITKVVNPEMRQAFLEHIRHTDLIVVGYSGWDDLVMRNLKKWIEDDSLLMGNLYWIPHKSQAEIQPNVLEFLNNCPVNRVIIIENEGQPLNADSFLLAMCHTLNGENGGFAPYRKGIIDFAVNQHDFILAELEKHPDFKPSNVKKHIQSAKTCLTVGNIQGLRQELDKALEIIKSEDLPNELRAKAYFEIGLLYKQTGIIDYQTEALNYLNESAHIWDKFKSAQNGHLTGTRQGYLGKAKAWHVMAEIYLRLGNVTEADRHLRTAIAQYAKFDDQQGFAYCKLLFVELHLRTSEIEKATLGLRNCLAIFEQTQDAYGLALYHLYSGEIETKIKHLPQAEKHYRDAIALLDKVMPDSLILGHCFKGYAWVSLQKDNKELADQHFQEAASIYTRHHHEIGLAAIQSLLGDYQRRHKQFTEAAEAYQTAADFYRNNDELHGLTNALADLVRCSEEIAMDPERKQDLLGELRKVLQHPHFSNPYAKEILQEALAMETTSINVNDQIPEDAKAQAQVS